MKTIFVVGVGVDPGNLPPSHLEVIERAEVLVGGKRLLEAFSGLPARKLVLASGVEDTLFEVKSLAEDKHVVILASGDPLFFGIGRRALEVFGRENVALLPAPTAFQEGFARLKIPWEGLKTVSLHGRGEEGYDLIIKGLAGGSPVAVYTDPKNTPGDVADFLLGFGLGDLGAAVAENLGSSDERTTEARVRDLAGMEFAPLNTMVVFPRERVREGPVLGLGSASFEVDRGQITKEEARAVILFKLELSPGLVVWDVGAGSGSVSVEAARLAPGLMVYAVEREPKRAGIIRRNVENLSGIGVKVVEGEAPESLKSLPDPHRVFVGGTGGNFSQVTGYCLERLVPGGVLVAALVTLESLREGIRLGAESGCEGHWVLLQASRGALDSGGGVNRFVPETPVFILKLEKA